MSERGPIVEASPAAIDPEEILALRRGPGANCSSIGSTLDVLFLSATVAGMILVSVAAALGEANSEKRAQAARGDAGDPARAAGEASEASDASEG